MFVKCVAAVCLAVGVVGGSVGVAGAGAMDGVRPESPSHVDVGDVFPTMEACNNTGPKIPQHWHCEWLETSNSPTGGIAIVREGD
ncbi:MAG: hypothetical protein HOQ24_06395 [Mycobacteriaceae bacterium]|nr:hypothetical protein [Mycobacteriaceae bacterium]